MHLELLRDVTAQIGEAHPDRPEPAQLSLPRTNEIPPRSVSVRICRSRRIGGRRMYWVNPLRYPLQDVIEIERDQVPLVLPVASEVEDGEAAEGTVVPAHVLEVGVGPLPLLGHRVLGHARLPASDSGIAAPSFTICMHCDVHPGTPAPCGTGTSRGVPKASSLAAMHLPRCRPAKG
jgi:hypothetical protein